MLYNFKLHYESLTLNLTWLKYKQLSTLFVLPVVEALHLLFSIFKLENIEHPKLFNYFYLFRFFFSATARVANYNTYFLLGKHYSNLEIGFSTSGKQVYFPLYLFCYEIQPLVNLTIARDYVYTNKQFSLVLWDTNIFTEKKTNVGLFDLEDPLHYKLCLN